VKIALTSGPFLKRVYLVLVRRGTAVDLLNYKAEFTRDVGHARGLTPVLPIHPSNGATAQIGPWPPLLRFRNNNVLRCEVVSLTTNPR
jgi:hypothetical protein